VASLVQVLMSSQPNPPTEQTRPSAPPPAAAAADVETCSVPPPGTAPPHRTAGTASATPVFHPLPMSFGRYQVQKLLGAGGMGEVYLAHDTQLDRPVALKIPHFAGSEEPQVRERFLREARAAATIHHAHICPVHDVGEIDGILYMTMSFIEGRSLGE